MTTPNGRGTGDEFVDKLNQSSEPELNIEVADYLSPEYNPDAPPPTTNDYSVIEIVHHEVIVDPLDEGEPAPNVDPGPVAPEPTPEPETATAQELPPVQPSSTLYYDDAVYDDPIIREYDPSVGPDEPLPAPDPKPDEYDGYDPTRDTSLYINDDRLHVSNAFAGRAGVAGPVGSAMRYDTVVGYEGDESNVYALSQQPWLWLAADKITGYANGAEVTSATLLGTSAATAATDAGDPENAWRGPIYRTAGIAGKPALDFRPDYATDADARRLFAQTTADAIGDGHFTTFVVAQLPSSTATDGLTYSVLEVHQGAGGDLLRITASHDLDTTRARLTATVHDATRNHTAVIEQSRNRGAAGNEDVAPILATIATADDGVITVWTGAEVTSAEYFQPLGDVSSTPIPVGPLNYNGPTQFIDIGRAFQGLIAEVLVYRGTAALTEHERWQVRRYLASKYGSIEIEPQPLAPSVRNQVANPSGEINKIGTWVASNGSVTMAVNQATPGPIFGSKHVTYTVGSNVEDGYFVSYRAPMGAPYYGAFTIGPDRVAGSSVYVSAPQAVGVTLYAEFLALVGTQFYRVGVSPIGDKLMLDARAPWRRLQASMVAPEGATHYYINVAVSGSVADPTPQIGTQLWLEGAFVTDTGSVAGIKYVDGDQVDGDWEGPPHNSSSVRGISVRPVLIVPNVATPIEDQNPDPKVYGPDPDTANFTQTSTQPLPPAKPRYREQKPEDVLSEAGVRVGQLCLTGDVSLGSLVLNTQDDSGTVWVMTDMDGWWNLPDNDVPEIERGWDDGAFETRGRYKSRVFTVSGMFVPRSPSQVAAARDKLIRAVNMVHEGSWVRTREGSLVKGSKVWLSGRPEITTNKLSGKTEFSIGLRAPDPIKYELVGGRPPGHHTTVLAPLNHTLPGRMYDRRRQGDAWETGERLWRRAYSYSYPEAFLGPSDVTLHNIGNAPTAPLLRLYGPTSGTVHIVNDTTKQEMKIVRTLSRNEILEIDCVTRQVKLNNVPNKRNYMSTFTDWLRLAPGPNDIYFYDEAAAQARLEIHWQSGWIG